MNYILVRFCRLFRLIPSLALALGGLMAAPASAQMVTGPVLRLDAAQADGGYASFLVQPFDAYINSGDRSMSWSRTTPLLLVDESRGQTVGTLRSASVYFRQYPPRLTINFSIEAGANTSYFAISSALLHFPPIRDTDSIGRATASITLVDMNLDGAEVHSIGNVGTGIYSACFDGWAGTGDLFSSEVARLLTGPGGTVSATQTDPPSGMRPVGERVWSGCSISLFSLTAGDRMTAYTRFDLDSTGEPIGDMNCDNRVNNLDIDAFILALSSREAYEAAYSCDWTNADINDDATVNNFDMDGFVALLTLY